jgi:hypothetical protein
MYMKEKLTQILRIKNLNQFVLIPKSNYEVYNNLTLFLRT